MHAKDKSKDKAMTKDLRVLKILQKAREFGDTDLLNEDLLANLINAEFKGISQNEREQIAEFLNALIESKDKATLS